MLEAIIIVLNTIVAANVGPITTVNTIGCSADWSNYASRYVETAEQEGWSEASVEALIVELDTEGRQHCSD